VEKQMAGLNCYENLFPFMSAMVITSYVKEGV
jgi:membrane-associated HD superfamily phosphohydrolase